jgi:hypothetical protein
MKDPAYRAAYRIVYESNTSRYGFADGSLKELEDIIRSAYAQTPKTEAQHANQ